MFSKTSERLFLERVKNEQKLTKQYSGREILELLQNIDDAYDSSCGQPCTASFILENNCLIVSNYGKPFTLDTLQRLCQGSVSSKKGKYIGSKGLGFRSILNWSRKIEIYSQSVDCEYIAVRFSTENAKKVFEQIKDKEHIQSQIEELKNIGIDAAFPIFKAPEPIDPIQNLGYNTQIKIYVSDDMRSHIINDMRCFDKNVLLFLPNVTSVVFSFDGKVKEYQKLEDCSNNVKISTLESGCELSNQSFFYFEDNNQKISGSADGTKNIRMAVAIPVDETEEQFKLYTFFPILNINSPFKALLHATFSLNDNRNNFESSPEDDKINQEVFTKLLSFFVSKVATLNLKERTIKLLSPINYTSKYKFPDDLSRLNCEPDYLNICKKEKIFYSINGEYICAIDECSPIIIKDSIPEPILDEKSSFSRLVQIDAFVESFVENINKSNPSKTEEYLVEQINTVSGRWDSKKRVQVFGWWCGMQTSKLPNLLKNTKNGFLNSTKDPCFLSGSIGNIPEWANINILYQEDETELLRLYKQRIEAYKQENNSNDNEKRILPRLISKGIINLQEQSSKQVLISPVNNSVGSDFNKAQEFLVWLWEIWTSDKKFDATIKENDFYVPTINKSVRKSKETYLGKEFNNELGVELFSKSGLNYDEIYCPDIEDKDLYTRFLREIGVNKYPQIYSVTTEHQDAPTYVKFVKTIRKFDYQGNVSWWKLKVNTIDNIKNILAQTPTETILKWINTDTRIKAALIIDDEPEDSTIEYKPRVTGKIYYDRWNIGWNLPSYMRYVFSMNKWIKIDEHLYSPNELIIAADSFRDLGGVFCISEEYIEKFADESGFTFEDLKMVLLKLGVKESYLDLDSSQFYNLLLKLGNNDDENSRKTSREIYRSIISNNRGTKSVKSLFYAKSEEKAKFLNEGKVLAKSQKGNIEYKPIQDVYFSSSAVLNLNDSYFIDIPPRSGNKDNFQEILGIKQYVQDYSISNPVISIVDNDFQTDFRSFLPCLLTYRTGNKTAVSLSIHLVSKITITVSGKTTIPSTTYSLLKESKSKWYIYIGDGISSYGNTDKCKIGEALEQVFNVYFNFPSKDFLNQVIRLFICTPEQRRYFIESDFGSSYEYESTLNEISRAEEIRAKIKEELSLDSEASHIVDEIDWMDLSNIKIQKLIFNLLKDTNHTIQELSMILERPISVSAYIKDSLWRCYLSKREHLYMSIYTQCESKQEYGKLINYWDGLDKRIRNITITDSISIEQEDNINTAVEFFFKDNHFENIEESKSDYMKICALYEKNKKELIAQFERNVLNLNDFTNNIENHSLLYFEKSVWEDKVNAFIDECQKEESQKQNVANNLEESVKLSDIIDSLEFKNDLESGKEQVPSSGKSSRGGFTERSQRKKDRQNKKQGNLAEYYVILALAEKKITEVNAFFNDEPYSIIWKSGAANEVVKHKDDNYDYDTSQVSDDAGYDIEVVNKNDPNKKMCLEVKSSSSSDCSFFMSIGEYTKAKNIEEEGGCYRIVFVSNMDTDHKKVTLIDRPISKAFDINATQYNVVFNKEKFDKQ